MNAHLWNEAAELPDDDRANDPDLNLLQRVYGQRGYLVIARRAGTPDPVIGDVVTDTAFSRHRTELVGQPFRIVSQTTLEDFMAQDPAAFPPHGYDRFYRAEAD